MSHLANPSVIKEIFRSHHIRPVHGLGQNFLADNNILDKIITAAEIGRKDVILEIGPGLGVLTRELAKRSARAIAVDIDPVMIDILKGSTKDLTNLQIIHADILDMDLGALGLKNFAFKVVSNLPYQITSPILKILTEREPKPAELYVTIQKEVAERLTAKPPDANLLSNAVSYYSEAKVLFGISKKSFWPEPEIDSAFVSIKNRRDDLYGMSEKSREEFFRIIRAGFSSKRKQILNNLSHGFGLNKIPLQTKLKKINIDPTRRAETLSLDEWYSIWRSLKLDLNS